MNTLIGKHIYLRAIEPDDLPFLYQIENNELFWPISNTQKPFSKFLLQQYLENAQQDIYQAKQLRLMIINRQNNDSIGMIDLFDFNPKHRKAGVGIVISKEAENNGFATQALKLVINYSFTHLDLHQVYANITESNLKSIRLFENQLFKKIGIKKDWTFTNGKYQNEVLYQLINE